MGRRDPRVDAYIERAAPFARPILTHLRELVHRACPEAEETMKWGMPFFDHRGPLCNLAAFKGHCAFGFWKGALLVDDAATAAEAMGHFGRITSPADLPPDAEVEALVRRAAALNEEGVKAPRTKTAPRASAEAPPALLAALEASPAARAAWEGFTPGKRREYEAWIAEAKTDATRARRVATAVGWIAEGKSRNWKYERPRG